ncbi:OprO/OprP family phosphate-selective porin [uncultured Enterovirga sp.]|uniref:OprO/OprP family phosphate-selective porin n=1 Tax=uncultured Enterovirga sp. TaxID=2026352 RepID=UPI0035C993EE
MVGQKRKRRWGWVALALTASAGSPAGAEEPKVTLDAKGFSLRAGSNDEFEFHLGGRLHADFGSGGSRAVSREFPDSADFRRVWIEPKIIFDKKLIFNLQYDPTSASTPINNLFVSYKGFSPFILTGGNFKEPFSLEQLQSNNDTTFMERSLADTFTPSRNTGFAVAGRGEWWSLSAGVFGGNINSTVDKGGIAGTARATIAPILTETEVLHLGVAGSYRSLNRAGPEQSFSSRPESFLFRTSLVDTGKITDGRSVGRVGLEAAYANGPFRIQSEFMTVDVDRDFERSAVTFNGGYVYGAWVINGKGPKYSLDADDATEIGVFKRVEPESGQRVSRGGSGVFEFAARYSAVELTSRNIRGGYQQDVTAGLNWYPEPFIRIMANYVHAWADPTAAKVTGRATQADIGQVRLQIAF